MSIEYLFFAVFIIVAIFFIRDFIKNYRSHKEKQKEESKDSEGQALRLVSEKLLNLCFRIKRPTYVL